MRRSDKAGPRYWPLTPPALPGYRSGSDRRLRRDGIRPPIVSSVVLAEYMADR